MNTRLRRELRLLRLYVITSMPLLVVLSLAAFASKAEPTRFEEISVERINIVEPDGSLRMVISNIERSPDLVIDGRTIPAQGGGRPGMIFYNEEGDENGGLAFDSKMAQDGGYAYSQLSLDRYKQDQVTALRYYEQDGRWFSGMQVWDRPAAPYSEIVDELERLREMPEGPEKEALRETLFAGHNQRLFVGRNWDGASMVRLRDADGNTRIRMQVDSLGTPRLEFFDESGDVIYSLPELPR